jgi:hypothetical protein
VEERIPFTFGSKTATHVLDDRDVSRGSHSITGIRGGALVIRSSLKQYRITPLTARAIYVRTENNAIPHGRFHAVFYNYFTFKQRNQ